MNRYTAVGVLQDAAAGRSVIYLALSGGEATGARHMLLDIAEQLDLTLDKVVRAHGRERIDLPSGGRIRVMIRGRGSLRGHTPDVLVLGAGVDIDDEEVEVFLAIGSVEILRAS